eukprot:2781062-Rhodomonas_salina.1
MNCRSSIDESCPSCSTGSCHLPPPLRSWQRKMVGGRCASQFKLHDMANISFWASSNSVTHRFVLACSQDIQVRSVARSRQLRSADPLLAPDPTS